jgi:hypothetical protein
MGWIFLLAKEGFNALFYPDCAELDRRRLSAYSFQVQRVVCALESFGEQKKKHGYPAMNLAGEATHSKAYSSL